MAFDKGSVLNNTYWGCNLHTSEVGFDAWDLEGYHSHRGFGVGFDKKAIEDNLHIGEGVDSIRKVVVDMGYNLHKVVEDIADYRDCNFASCLVGVAEIWLT